MVAPQNDLESSVALLGYSDDDHGRDGLLQPASLMDEKQDNPCGQRASRISRSFQLWCLFAPRLARCFLPSWLDSTFKYPGKSPISTLDGLRGLVSLVVFNHHFGKCFEESTPRHWINNIPVFRYFWIGGGSVAVFFIISGYVLSHKPLQLMRKKDSAAFAKTMSSSILRRAFRLYLPCIIMSFIMMCLAYSGAFIPASKAYFKLQGFLQVGETPPQATDMTGLLRVLWGSLRFIFCATFPFDIDMWEFSYEQFDYNQWTIPHEMRGSMALFTAMVGLSRLTTIWRLISEFLAFYYLYQTKRYWICLFFAGLLLCDLDLTRRDYYTENPDQPPCSGLQGRIFKLLLHRSDNFYKFAYITLFVIGFGMVSSVNEVAPGTNWIPVHLREWGISVEPDHFSFTVGATIYVWVVANSPTFAPFFNSRPIQYLGYISYALYLVHGTVLRSLGFWWLPTFLRLGTDSPNNTDLTPDWWAGVDKEGVVRSYILGFVCTGFAAFLAADMFWTKVDIRVVKFARLVENRLTAGYE